MFKTLSFLAACLLAHPAFAACEGADIIADMPAEKSAAMRAEAARVPYPNGIIWRAERGEQVIHLVGTMHFADPRHQSTLDQVRPLIDRSAAIFLELADGDEQRLNDRISREPGVAFIIEGPTLPDLLSEAEWQKLQSSMADRGVPGFMAAKMQPWMAMLTLGMSKCVFQQTLEGKRGLDDMIMNYAGEIGNPARGLEPYDTVLDLFSVYSEAELLEFLRLFLTMDNFDPDDQNATMAEAYFREEIRLLWQFGIQQSLDQPQGYTPAEIHAEYAKLEEALIGKRNRNWMPLILEAAKTGEVFVAAGALHMPGDQGVLQLLENEGFTVTAVPRLP